MRTALYAALLLLIAVPAGAAAPAASPASAPASVPGPASAPAPPSSAEMDAWLKAAAPNENHAVLAKMAGSFKVESRFFAGPDAEPHVSYGTAEQAMVFGGRYLRQDFTGDMGGQPFQGTGFIGYDNLRKRYFSYWLDSGSTMPLQHEGTCDNKACTSITLRGEYTDPLTGKKKKSRTITETTDDARVIFTMFDEDKKGKEFRSLELIYTRR